MLYLPTKTSKNALLLHHTHTQEIHPHWKRHPHSSGINLSVIKIKYHNWNNSLICSNQNITNIYNIDHSDNHKIKNPSSYRTESHFVWRWNKTDHWRYPMTSDDWFRWYCKRGIFCASFLFAKLLENCSVQVIYFIYNQ